MTSGTEPMTPTKLLNRIKDFKAQGAQPWVADGDQELLSSLRASGRWSPGSHFSPSAPETG